jgi:hypothetical protein
MKDDKWVDLLIPGLREDHTINMMIFDLMEDLLILVVGNPICLDLKEDHSIQELQINLMMEERMSELCTKIEDNTQRTVGPTMLNKVAIIVSLRSTANKGILLKGEYLKSSDHLNV